MSDELDRLLNDLERAVMTLPRIGGEPGAKARAALCAHVEAKDKHIAGLEECPADAACPAGACESGVLPLRTDSGGWAPGPCPFCYRRDQLLAKSVAAPKDDTPA